ncbi:uncharacterized protein TRIVIDRAFT_62674 [Trichoderma virens Gv29-8]|uniref:Uncharacterized protein n=1 Tax=Hypocrea virens (strain Gv29-8 / FGSC 10586) TaxID=413071 RepID=G9MEQ4_HYPVG|nr:uncharacterized protein TRIVIDRAFT_62674 [Trichoderma virens Gv29-8]EHK26872.1 hypothetical protein TRIVIDRAFT_62674 [Trichoderma virens Gv29-8]
MSNDSGRVRCHCGKRFNSSQAMAQHNIDPRPAPTASIAMTLLTCSCGKPFLTTNAMQQHKRDAPIHAIGKNQERNNNKESTQTKHPTRSRVNESNTSWKHRNYGLFSGSGIWHSDVGDNYGQFLLQNRNSSDRWSKEIWIPGLGQY